MPSQWLQKSLLSNSKQATNHQSASQSVNQSSNSQPVNQPAIPSIKEISQSKNLFSDNGGLDTQPLLIFTQTRVNNRISYWKLFSGKKIPKAVIPFLAWLKIWLKYKWTSKLYAHKNPCLDSLTMNELKHWAISDARMKVVWIVLLKQKFCNYRSLQNYSIYSPLSRYC